MTQNKDIKPVRPETSSKRGSVKTKGGGILFSSTITVLNLIGLIILFLWFFNTSGNQQQAGQNFIERISLVEESSSSNSAIVTELSQNVDADLKFVNKEIRKLWDLSNKRNRKNISANLNSIESLQNEISELSKVNETLSARQRALTLELAKINKILEKNSLAIENSSQNANPEIDLNKLTEIEESINSFDAYRVQVNQSIIELRQKLNDLELKLSDTQKE